MRKEELKAVFDKQAGGYDALWEGLAPIRDGLYLLVESLFAGLPEDARVLCVGVGTGAELAHLAHRHPGWRFTVVEPSGAMLDVCRRRADREAFASRCTFHEGYVDSLVVDERHHAATCFLVSQFILERSARSTFFRTIAERLRPGGLLASADLAAGANATDHAMLLRAWLRVMTGSDVGAERLERARVAFSMDVAVLPPAEVASVIESGGFEHPVQFYQAALLHAWCSRRQPNDPG